MLSSCGNQNQVINIEDYQTDWHTKAIQVGKRIQIKNSKNTFGAPTTNVYELPDIEWDQWLLFESSSAIERNNQFQVYKNKHNSSNIITDWTIEKIHIYLASEQSDSVKEYANIKIMDTIENEKLRNISHLIQKSESSISILPDQYSRVCSLRVIFEESKSLAWDADIYTSENTYYIGLFEDDGIPFYNQLNAAWGSYLDKLRMQR